MRCEGNSWEEKVGVVRGGLEEGSMGGGIMC
jgi:hypothetical protein